MDIHLLTVLLSWTVSLSPYSHPHVLPEIEYKPHTFFIEHVCLGTEKCQAAAWYNDNGIIYLDERMQGQTDAYTRSVVVHELAHYLQDISGQFGKQDCKVHQYREREAYSIQRQYLNKIAGRFVAIYQNYPPCVY